uniref:DUF4010 domain-containing protein n=1 Tax=Fervidicoccus fontis TaxID=683846 RepID=A0A7J3ZLB1_9CREN
MIERGLLSAIEDPVARSLVLCILALLQGSLIGLERDKAKIDIDDEILKSDFPGLRTFGLLALAGAISGLLSKYNADTILSTVVPVLASVFVLMLVGAFMSYRMLRQGYAGITTYIVMLIAYLAGVMTGIGLLTLSLSVTFLTVGVLALKSFEMKVVRKISYEEFVDALELGILVFILGPIVFSLDMEVFGVSLENAYVFFVILLAISLTSYHLYKLAGERGLLHSSFVGGLVNSEAALVSVARIVKRSQLTVKYANWILLGMMVRSLILSACGAFPFMSSLGSYLDFLKLLLPGYAFGLTILVLELLLMGKEAESTQALDYERGIEVGRPLDYKSAIRGVIVYLVLLVASKIVYATIGEAALLVVALVGGFGSAAATIFSLLSLAKNLSPTIIAIGSLLAVAGGLLNKPLYASLVAPRLTWEIGKAVLLPSVGIVTYTVSVLLLVA